jgi:two-component sensor histidine kinase
MLRFALASWRRLWHDGLRPGSLRSLLFALTCVTIATLVRIAFGEISSASAVFAPYYSATLVAALVGGAQAGGLAAISGAVAALWLFVPPDWESHAFDREQLVSYFLFATSSLVIIWAAKSYRELLYRLREEEERRGLLNRELAHRTKNTLSIVQSLVSQTLRGEPVLRGKLNDRLTALAATSDLLVKSEWRSAGLKEILAGEFAPYDPARFAVDGADFECPAEVATLLALIFHELTTNAAKYGALSAPGGRIALSWIRTGERVDFEWRESGGPPPTTLRAEGFGTTLLRKGLRQFDGVVDMDFAPEGLCCRLWLSMPRTRPDEAIHASPGRMLDAKTAAAASVGVPFVLRPPPVVGPK